MPKKRRESAFKRTQKFKKSAIYYPDFGVFLLFQNHQTLTNSHFQFLKEEILVKKVRFSMGKV